MIFNTKRGNCARARAKRVKIPAIPGQRDIGHPRPGRPGDAVRVEQRDRCVRTNPEAADGAAPGIRRVEKPAVSRHRDTARGGLRSRHARADQRQRRAARDLLRGDRARVGRAAERLGDKELIVLAERSRRQSWSESGTFRWCGEWESSASPVGGPGSCWSSAITTSPMPARRARTSALTPRWWSSAPIGCCGEQPPTPAHGNTNPNARAAGR